LTKKHKCDSIRTVEQAKSQHKNTNQIPKGIRKETSQKRKENKNNMANKFEMGSKEFAIPEQTNNHLSDEEFEDERDKYDAIEYETLKDEEGYVSKKEVSKDAEKMLKEFKKKKIGANMFDLFERIA
jgi:hypothetical protein